MKFYLREKHSKGQTTPLNCPLSKKYRHRQRGLCDGAPMRNGFEGSMVLGGTCNFFLKQYGVVSRLSNTNQQSQQSPNSYIIALPNYTIPFHSVPNNSIHSRLYAYCLVLVINQHGLVIKHLLRLRHCLIRHDPPQWNHLIPHILERWKEIARGLLVPAACIDDDALLH